MLDPIAKSAAASADRTPLLEIKNLKMQMAQNMGQDPSKMDTSTFPDDLFQEEAEKRVKLGLLVGE